MIVQYWHSEPPAEVAAAFASFDEHNPGLEHAVFDEPRAAAFVEEHLSPREAAAFRACAVPAMQADYFRYCAIHALGGLYVDADFECVADLRPLLDRPGGIVFGRQGPLTAPIAAVFEFPREVGEYRAVSNDLFAFAEPGHPLLATAIEVATANVERRVADGPKGVWVTTGPGIFTSLYLLARLGSVDAFLDYCAGSILAPSAPLTGEIVGDATAAASLFEGVELRPRRDRRAWVRPVELPRPTRGREVYWPEATGSIFR